MPSQLIDKAKESFRRASEEVAYEARYQSTERVDCFFNVGLDGVEPTSASFLSMERIEIRQTVGLVSSNLLTFSRLNPLRDAVNKQCLKKGI